jgi:hypothetical protein
MDRRVVFVSLAVAVVAVAAVVGIVVARDHNGSADQTLDDFLALTTKREKNTWLVRYAFTRRVPSGGTLHQTITEGNRPPVHVLASSGMVTVDFGNRIASCTSGTTGPSCNEQKHSRSLSPSVVYRVAIGLGGYTLERGETVTVAGEQAQCFRLIAPSGKATATLGTETVQCYASDGVPLRSELHHDGVVDTREAVSVKRKVSDADLDGILRRLDQEQSAAGH